MVRTRRRPREVVMIYQGWTVDTLPSAVIGLGRDLALVWLKFANRAVESGATQEEAAAAAWLEVESRARGDRVTREVSGRNYLLGRLGDRKRSAEKSSRGGD